MLLHPFLELPGHITVCVATFTLFEKEVTVIVKKIGSKSSFQLEGDVYDKNDEMVLPPFLKLHLDNQ